MSVPMGTKDFSRSFLFWYTYAMDVTVILVVLILCASFFGESIFGFGGGLMSIPLLSMVLGVRDAVTLTLIFQLCMGILIWKSYKHIDWKTAKPMTLSIIVGTVVGTLLLAIANVAYLQLFLALAIILFLIKMIWFSGLSFGKKGNTLAAGSAGFGGGLFQGLIGTGGPILTMYLSATTTQKLAIRATLIYLLFVTSVVRIGISIPTNLMTTRILYLALITLPFFLIAITVGQRAQQKISDKYYRLSVYIILSVSAVVLLNKAL